MAKQYREIRYHIEVGHEPGTFDNDMDLLASDPERAYKNLQYVKEKYPGRKITITQIITTTTYKPISESDLEKLL